MAKIYFLNHPSNEPAYLKSRTTGNIVNVPWNKTNNHKRKFIVRKGTYLDNAGNQISDELYFWGEYEPDTQAILVSKSTPRAVHNMLQPAHSISMPPLEKNTDPYVFGMFRNICCRRGNIIYNPGDVLVFGKMDDINNTLEIDTVIVVERMEYTRKIPVNSQYYYASVLPLYPNIPRKYIEGVVYPHNTSNFSFVPCLPAKKISGTGAIKHVNATALFKKPQIQLASFGTKAHKNKMCKAVQLTTNRWNMIINEVHNFGLELGIKINKI